MSDTPASLLERLRVPHAEQAWGRFVKLYSPLPLYWARRVGLREPDASDLVQEVFVVLLRKLPDFQYDARKGFRNWLRTVAHNRWREIRRRHGDNNRRLVAAGLEHLQSATEMFLIELGNTEMGDDDLAKIKNLTPFMQKLTIWGNYTTDSGLEHLKGMTILDFLNLERSPRVSDAGLKHLEVLTKLTELNVSHTKVTSEGVKKLAAALPKCKIEWDGGVIEPKP